MSAVAIVDNAERVRGNATSMGSNALLYTVRPNTPSSATGLLALLTKLNLPH